MPNRISNLAYPALPKRNFWSSSKKIAIGSIFLLAANVLKEDEVWHEGIIRHAIFSLGSATFIDGIQSTFNNAMLWYSQKSEIYFQLQKKQNILISAFHCISMFMMLSRYGDTWLTLPKNISVFSFSFPESMQDHKAGPILGFFHMPLIIPVMFAFAIIGLAYNIKELALNVISRQPRQGNSPFFGFLNAFAQIGLTATLANKLMPSTDFNFTIDPNLDLKEQLASMKQAYESYNTKPALGYVLSWLNMSSLYQVFQSVITLFFNTIITFISRPKIEVEIIEKKQSSARHQRRRKSAQQELFQPVERSIQHETASAAAAEEMTPSAPPRQRKKIKTRGIPGEGYADETTTNEGIEILSSILYHQDARERTNKLDLINDLRNFSQIKEHHINKELSQLTQFLPKGRIINTTGSQHILSWEFQRKTYRLKYETPHGQGVNNVFKGRKLHKILNVLETGYLWGWGHDKIHAYMDQHNSQQYLGTLVNILLRRPDFDEPDLPTPGM